MLRQLFLKEIRLQKSNLYFIVAIVLVWGILLALATRAEVKLGGRSDATIGLVVSLLQVGFVGFCLLVIAPLLVGAALVAEERKLGVWEWQLSLPCPRRTQWAVKLAVGSAITLALALVVQPLLDSLLRRAMGSYQSGIPLPSAFLGMNEIYRTVPLLLMMSAAFVSSMAKDPYKAFFLGIVFFGFVAACFSVLDPAHLLIMPWNLEGNLKVGGNLSVSRFLVSGHVPWMLGLGLSAGLGALALFNFRLEGFRWRRFLGQLAGVFLLAAAVTWIGLQWEFGVGGIVSQKAGDVEPLILDNRSHVPGAGQTVDWAGIDPILVRRANFATSRTPPVLVVREETCWGQFCPSRIVRIPGSGSILAEIHSFPVLADSSELWPQVLELGIDKPYLRSIPSLLGAIIQVFPGRSGFLMQTWRSGTFLSSRWPMPIKVGGLLWKVFAQNPLPTDPVREFYEKYRSGAVRIGGVVFKATPMFWPVNLAKGYFALTIPDKTVEGKPYEKWLVRKEANDTWTVIHKGKTHNSYYCVSDDGKWYSTKPSSGRYAGDSLPPRLDVYSCDHTASWTLENPEGELDLGSGGRDDIATSHDMGTRSSPLLRVSPSGRFLPFLRTKRTLKLEVDGKEQNTRYPGAVEFVLLDLQTGQERVLLRTKPDREARSVFESAMAEWKQWKSRRESGQAKKEEPFHQLGGWVAQGQNVPLYSQRFPPLLWAPGRDGLAIFFDESIYVFEQRGAQSMENAGKQSAVPENAVKQDAGDFALLGAVDLTGFRIRDVDFWDGGVMLAWGWTGLYRVDLAKALRPAQIPPLD